MKSRKKNLHPRTTSHEMGQKSAFQLKYVLRFNHFSETIIIYSVFILGKPKFKVILLKNSLN